jgi:pantoate--beta-alanine ligase
MQVFHSISALKECLSTIRKNGKTIGFVPTMGALHNGHLSLITRAKKENDVCVVSIFVNPTQFNNQQDLATYPRNLDKDTALLESVGCDIVFAPTAEEMYNDTELNSTFSFDFAGLDQVMEGKFRPGHFNGVVQVVSKLFNIVEPDNAYFGEKDFQQVAIIRHMVKVFQLPVTIVSCPIIREGSGLAMSSRNELLTADERNIAINISRVLKESTTFAAQKTPDELTQWVVDSINACAGLTVEYFEIVDGYSLQKVSSWAESEYIVGCITVFCGKVRLIDNITYQCI